MVALEEAAWNAPAPRRPEEGGDPDIGDQEEVEGGPRGQCPSQSGTRATSRRARGPVSSRLDSLLCGQVLMEATILG